MTADQLTQPRLSNVATTERRTYHWRDRPNKQARGAARLRF